MLRTAVIDNDTLVYLTKLKHLKIFDSLRSLFQQIHIPQEIRREYEIQQGREPDRVWILDRLRPNEGFYSFCTRFDKIVLTILQGEKDIHRGEAEVFAQQKEVNAHYILSDDSRFRRAIKAIDSNVKVLTTLHIIAMLDIRQLLMNSEEILKALHAHYRFESFDLRTAYKEAARELGLYLPKKVLNNKCSFKKLGLN
jgi:predicted nucleic acid-binding protein